MDIYLGIWVDIFGITYNLTIFMCFIVEITGIFRGWSISSAIFFWEGGGGWGWGGV